jgi:hypothetical protein
MVNLVSLVRGLALNDASALLKQTNPRSSVHDTAGTWCGG